MIGIDQLLVDIDLQLVGIDQQLAYIWSDLTKDEIHMTGTMTNPMSVDLGLWMEDRLFICPCLTFLLLYILNCSTLCLNKTFDFMILMLHLVAVYY